MARRAICRVWYGKRSGLPQSFKDIGNFYAAAKFAAFIVAGRIEVVREPLLVERRNYSPPMRKVAAAA